MYNEKGCVYFFRHVGLSPVKIGYTTSDNPNNRFKAFKVYAPYGAEILGYFIAYDPCMTERELHKDLKEKRLNGEWFDLTELEVKEIINYQKRITNYFDNYYKKK